MHNNPYKKKRINVYTLGCSKNVYDSEKLMSALKAGNLEVVHEGNVQKNDVVVVNTCGFINDAKQESINSILEFVHQKEAGDIDELVVMGCLSERYKPELEKEIPEVDQYFGVNDFNDILNRFGIDYKKELIGERLLSNDPHYAYLKISDGCNRKCSFCAIPLIKGVHRSKPMEELLDETRRLVHQGVKEVILIGQDTTYYGIDLYKEKSLGRLMGQLADVDGLEWLRLHYVYPASFPMDILDVIKGHPNICNYIDMPVQHISDNVLKRMRRGVSARKTRELLENFRNKIPDAAIRTTLITGFPGETDDDFEQLMEFVSEYKFDRLGVFAYSHEENTFAHEFEDDVPEGIKEERMQLLMAAQQKISFEKNREKIGKSYRVLIDRLEGEYFIGRTEYDSPEVDNEVLIASDTGLTIGSFYPVEIYDTTEYDLFGKINSL